MTTFSDMLYGLGGIPAVGGGTIPFSTGSYFFVDSTTGSNGNTGKSPAKPFKTIDYAIGKCTASKGDVIVVMPGHTETITGAGGITCDVAGISIIGLGNANLRPTLTWSATASTILVTADNVLLRNFICKVSIDSVVTGISITGAGCTLDAVDFQETSAKQMLVFIQTAATADYLTIKNCRHRQVAAGSAKWIDLVGADYAEIRNNDILVQASTHVIGGTTTESLDIVIDSNIIVNPADAAQVVLLASSTGMVSNNAGGGAKSAIAGGFALASAFGRENYTCNTANKNGLLDPVVDS